MNSVWDNPDLVDHPLFLAPSVASAIKCLMLVMQNMFGGLGDISSSFIDDDLVTREFVYSYWIAAHQNYVIAVRNRINGVVCARCRATFHPAEYFVQSTLGKAGETLQMTESTS